MYHRKKTYGFGLYTWKRITAMVDDGYIPVANATELNGIRNTTPKTMGLGTIWEDTYVTGLDKKYVQVNNIDLSGFQAGAGWVRLGSFNPNVPFSGTYDGNNLVIKNLYINTTSTDLGWGLFGFCVGANLQNIITQNADVKTGNRASTIGRIDNCYANNVTCIDSKIRASAYGGGVFETITNNTLVENIITIRPDVLVTGADVIIYTGGIVAALSESSNSGTQSIIRNLTCYFPNVRNSVNSDFRRIGGVVGGASRSVGIENSRSIGGSVIAAGGEDGVGGLVGYMFLSQTSGTNRVPRVLNCYSTSAVSRTAGSIQMGGLVGSVLNGIITNSYYDKDTSGLSDTGKGLPRTTFQMQQGTADSIIAGEAMYTGWDGDIWNFGTNTKYPKLKKI
jgi:hypothetical protein